MSQPDRLEGNLPTSWSPAAASVPANLPVHGGWEDLPDPETPPRRITPRLVLRSLRRYWWQILLLWSIGSAALMGLAHFKVKPQYTAVALLKVEPTSLSVLAPAAFGTQDKTTWMETQVELLTSTDVLNAAAKDESLRDVGRIKNAEDPAATLAKLLAVNIPPKTDLIAIGMTSPSATEGALIVNAVVDSYMQKSSTWVDAETRTQIDKYKEMKGKFTREVENQRETLKRLNNNNPELGGIGPEGSESPIYLEEYRAFKDRAARIALDIIEAEAALETLEEQSRSRQSNVAQASNRMSPELIDESVKQAFLADPEVINVLQQRQAALRNFTAVKRIAIRSNDPALMRHKKDLDEAEKKYGELWTKKAPGLRQQFAANASANSGEQDIYDELEMARMKLGKLRKEQADVLAELEEVRLSTDTDNNNALLAQFAQQDLEFNNRMLEKITATLEQMELEAHGQTKITPISPARAQTVPSSDNRLRLMAAAPVAMLTAVLCVFLLVELRGARVGTPDELVARTRLGVIGIVPPLPNLKGSRGTRALRDQRQRLEEFVQSLDHLRVTLCAATATSGHRCVIITSAIGGEGKTTLAAQLAGRCANAGLHTLLIDADLRRPALGTLLEVPEGPGLAEVLLDEASPESAMVVIGNAGGFHLLPAGAGGHDPSRLLQGERLGQLIARLREAFDIVIVDAPPVLPVPDALLLGRWTDGAVMAVRHDISRYPLVERAKRRLASVGLPILGAVVNGIRPPESSYCGYSSYYVDSPEPALPEPAPFPAEAP